MAALILVSGLCACHSAPPQAPDAMGNAAAPAPVTSPPAAAEAEPEIDPGSPDAAVAVVRDYYALIAARRFDAAAARMAPAPDAHSLQSRFGDFTAIRADVGPAGDSEGAAGSIYVTVPARITATRKDGARTIIAETATLRRVNDVPGSTAEQRRWHIVSVVPAADDAQ